MIQLDFFFLATKEHPSNQLTILTAVDVRTQLATAIVVPSKKASQKYVNTELKRFIYETGRTQAIMQTDDEASIKAVAKNLIRELGGLSFRKAPMGSS